jgi:hypothetical protein|tara:strand:- start:10 stop:162 length:153 start_codon:yes stop_codon:yes gene_type:complete
LKELENDKNSSSSDLLTKIKGLETQISDLNAKNRALSTQLALANKDKENL